MTQTAGRRRATKHSRPRRQFGPTAALLLIGALIAVAAWWFLVTAAIVFGRAGRSGEGAGWLFCVAASAGAVVCLVLVFVLLSRVLHQVGLIRDQPRMAGGRRRAR